MERARNIYIPLTRRYHDLRPKVAKRDSEVALKLIKAWDIHNDLDLVLDIFLKDHKNLSDFRYWELLKVVWIISGSTEKLPIFNPLLKSTRKQKHCFMSPEEHKKFKSLENTFNVWCACNGVPGISWTLDLEKAKHFQLMFNKSVIIEKTIEKSNCLAFIERNSEEEILIL